MGYKRKDVNLLIRRRRLLMDDERTGNPELDLISAIVQLAISDYTQMIKQGKRASKRVIADGKSAEDFLASDYFDVLTCGCIDGLELLNKIDEGVKHV